MPLGAVAISFTESPYLPLYGLLHSQGCYCLQGHSVSVLNICLCLVSLAPFVRSPLCACLVPVYNTSFPVIFTLVFPTQDDVNRSSDFS